MQQLRRGQPRRDGAGADRSSRPRASENADIIGLSGLITPSLEEMAHVAREMERAGLQAAAADRRRDHLARAHRGEDRAELFRARWCGCRTPRAACGVCRACCRPSSATSYVAEVRADYEQHARAARGQEGARAAAPDRRGARARAARPTGRATRRRCRAQPGITVLQQLSARASSSTTSTGRRSSRPGSCPAPIPKILRGPGGRRGRAQAARRSARRCSSASCASSWLTRERRVRPVPGGAGRRRRHRDLRRRVAQRRC